MIRFEMSAAELEQRGQFRGVRYDSDGTITLDDRELIEDDAPAIGQPEGATDRSWFERLSRGVHLRKDLVLHDPRARAAYLVFNGRETENNDQPLRICLNDVEIVRPPTRYAHPSARQYYTTDWGGSHFDNWFVVQVPVGALRQGENQIVLWSESEETSWEVMVAADREYWRGSETRLQHPNRSAKSRDGGKHWDFDRLGWKDEIDGEYCVRLSLHRHVSGGRYVSPVIDLAGEEGIRHLLSLSECRVCWDIDAPKGTRAVVRVRFGRHPTPDAEGWSEAQQLDGFEGTWHDLEGRYLQFEVDMDTEDPLRTPVLKGMTVATRVAGAGRQRDLFTRLQRLDNGRVIRSSVDYVYEDPDQLKDLREAFELDAVVAGAASEFDAQLRLMRWAYRVPLGELDRYAWTYRDLLHPQRDSDGRILLHGAYAKRRRDGHCLYCNLALVAALVAMGHPARWVNISTKHTYGHEVTEVWSNDFDKWVFLDSTRDYYIYDPDTGIPLSLVEIGHRLAEVMPGPATWEFPVQWQLPEKSMLDGVRIAYREGDNEHTVLSEDEIEGQELLTFKGHVQMPLRNDFASRPHPLPWRISSNWGSDQFYCHYSEMFPRKEEYQHHTNRWQDFNPTLHQAELTLSETAGPGVLRVDVDTETPHFDVFLARVDSGDWRPYPTTGFEWRLHEGLNRLCVKTRNRAGVCGPESRASIVANR